VRSGSSRSAAIHVLDAATGQDRPITSPYEAGWENPSGFTADGRWIVASSQRYVARGTAIALVPVDGAPRAESRAVVVMSDLPGGYVLWQGMVSPDDRWIAVQAAPIVDPLVSTLYVVPRAGGRWMQVTEGRYWDDKPRWSADGRILYFVSSRRGDFNVWAIRFDPSAGIPTGNPFPVTSFGGPRRMILPMLGGPMQVAVGRDRMVLPIVDVAGGIWMLENVAR
jgi:dipeptidyl aminopeptidase/acylaminoacyl peptidase